MGRRGRRRRFRRRLGLALLLPLLILLRPGDWFGGGPREGGSRPDSQPTASEPRVLPALPPVAPPRPESRPEARPESRPESRTESRTDPASAPATPGDGAAGSRAAAEDAAEGPEARAEDEAARLLILAYAAVREGRLQDAEARLLEFPAELTRTRAGERFAAQSERLRARIAQTREQVLGPLRAAAAQHDALAQVAGLRAAEALADPVTRAAARALCALPPSAKPCDPAVLAARWPEPELTTQVHAALARAIGTRVRVLVQDQIRQGSVYRVDADLSVVVAVPEGGGVTHPRVAPWDLDPRLLPAPERVRLAALLALRQHADQALVLLGTLSAEERGGAEAAALGAALR